MHPLVVLRERLAERRAGGVRFSLAWMEGRAEALMLIPREQRDVWRDVFAATREGWERAYQREAQTGPEVALVLIDPAVIAAALEEEPSGRRCDHCGGPIDPGKKSTARYCSDEHRLAAWRLRIADPRTAASGTASGCRSGGQHAVGMTSALQERTAA